MNGIMPEALVVGQSYYICEGQRIYYRVFAGNTDGRLDFGDGAFGPLNIPVEYVPYFYQIYVIKES